MRMCTVPLILSSLALPLAGCGVTPSGIPYRDGFWAEAPQTAQRFGRIPARRANASAMKTSSVRTVEDEDLKPLSPEWYARERAIDGRLVRQMNICRTC